MNDWPIYFSDNLHLSNPESETGILCLWTKKERLIKKLNPDAYSFIGQLYSKDYGIMILIRNLLAKNNLRNLVITGFDINNSGDTLIKLFKHGIDSTKKINQTETYLDDAITQKHIDLLRKRINIIDLRELTNFNEINNHLNINKKGPQGENIILELPKLTPPKRLPTDFSGFKARGIDFTTAYKTLINFILKFGVYDYNAKKLKAWNITFVAKTITKQDEQILKNTKKTQKKPDAKRTDNYYQSYFFKELNAWSDLQNLANHHGNKTALNIMSFEMYINEKDLEAAYEMTGTIPDTQKWDTDPHGNLIIRVENNLIKLTHLAPTGEVIEECMADNAKTLYKKITNDNKISLLYHALDIGGEIKRAENALKKREKYIQDKKE
ncbi:MAG: hypothetical protein ACLFN8_03625 [Candidatus Woesearchaeota archaeon]